MSKLFIRHTHEKRRNHEPHEPLRPLTEKLDALYRPDYQVSVAYRGCMICKELAELGVWEDIEQGLR
jgi:hypothetical protein